MKVLVLTMVFMMCQLVSLAKTAYVMVPMNGENLESVYTTWDLYIIGMDESGDKWKWQPSQEEKMAGIMEINKSESSYYGGAKLLEIKANTEEDFKIVVAYKIKNEEKYVILASEDILKEPAKGRLETNYTDGEKIEIINLNDDYNYSNFPGHKVKENIILTGMRVGDKKTEEEIADGEKDDENLRNIVRKFASTEAVGQDVYIHAGVSPTNSDDEFIVKDDEDKTLLVMKKKLDSNEGNHIIVLTDGTVAGSSEVNELKKNDKLEVKDGGVYLGNTRLIDGKAPFEMTIRIKKPLNGDNIEGDGSQDKKSIVKIDNVVQEFSDEKNFSFSKVKNFEVTFFKNNAIDIFMANEDVGVEDGAESNEVFVIESEGLHYEADVKMTSGSETLRKRESKIEIDIFTNNGMEIKSIKE